MDKKSVIIIGIDGLGGKFITGENAPFIHSLFKNGSYSTEMQSVLPTVSGPNWMSLFTGVDSPTHGIQGNGKEKSSSTTLFEMLPNSVVFYSASVSSAMKFGVLKGIKYAGGYSHFDSQTLSKADKHLQNNIPQLMFVHFDWVDIYGHIFGYGSRPYNWMAKKADFKVKKIVETLKQSENYKDTTIVVMSDHGGIGRKHHGSTPEEKTSFVVIVGEGIKANNKIAGDVNIFDITPTIGKILNIKNDQWEGTSLPIFEEINK